jgi:hypothetical protein
LRSAIEIHTVALLQPKARPLTARAMWQETSPTDKALPSSPLSLPKVYSVPIDPKALAHYGRELNLQDSATALSTLASAIARCPTWAEMPETVLIVRPTPQPVLAVLSCFDKAAEVRVGTQLSQLNQDISRLHYVSYHQAELDCQRLAAQLIDEFGRQELQKFHFTAIPRGGLFVLGLLAYTLGLTSEQLQPPTSTNVPWVVVDDCVFTGSRLHNFLQCNSHQKIIFAHLYSHPELRAKLQASEPRVLACLNARNVYDYAPGDLGNDYFTWQENHLTRLSGFRYWVGATDFVCFAWNEPDRFFWNSIAEKMEGCWLLLPETLCLKNRFKDTAKPPQVQVQEEGKGTLKPKMQIIFGKYQEQVVIGNWMTQESFGLTGVAADIWLAIVKYGNFEDIISEILQNYDIDASNLRANVSAFIQELIKRELITESND